MLETESLLSNCCIHQCLFNSHKYNDVFQSNGLLQGEKFQIDHIPAFLHQVEYRLSITQQGLIIYFYVTYFSIVYLSLNVSVVI